jgi:hypothetical protein
MDLKPSVKRFSPANSRRGANQLFNRPAAVRHRPFQPSAAVNPMSRRVSARHLKAELSFRTTRRWRVHSATLEKPTGFGARRGSAAFGEAMGSIVVAVRQGSKAAFGIAMLKS